MRNLLWKRGVWLIVLGWVSMWIIFPLWVGIYSVLWMFGWSMIALSAMVKLPLKWIAAMGAALMFLHNLADPITPVQFGHLAWLWTLLHVSGGIGPFPPHLLFGRIPINSFYSSYPLIPWMGVMAAGYAFGAVMKQPISSRRRALLWLGTASIVLFILLRTTNVYGNPHAPDQFTCGDFHRQTTLANTVIAFLDTEKYPPSLQFLLMTLGPGFLALAALDNLRTGAQGLQSRIARFFLLYGRVPLFYYVLHVYLIHALAIVVSLVSRQPLDSLLRLNFSRPWTSYGHGLSFVYAMWIAVVLILYLPCRWFMELKRRRHNWWLQYI